MGEVRDFQAKIPDLPPGSDKAVTYGCTCAQTDNHYGKGYRGKPGSYVIDEQCPIHRRRPDPAHHGMRGEG